MGFEEKYQDICKLVTSDIKSLQEAISLLCSTFGVLSEDVRSYISAPSKHIRAVMSFLYLRAVGIEPDESQINYQTIIELVHNASLIHDDIIDSGEFRRGNKSLNNQLGNKLSVIAGDLILAVALNKIEEFQSFKILNVFSKTIYNMCMGEVMQDYSSYKIPTLDEYIDKTYKKTGALFECALEGSCIIAKYNDMNASLFAKNLGIAFQIRDDIINVEKGGDDIKNGIYTAPVIYSGSFDNPFAGIEKAKDLLDNYLQGAKYLLRGIPDSQYKSALINLVELLKHE